MQLIKINSIPIEYQIEIERARLEVKAEGELRSEVTHRPPQLHIDSRNAEVRMDTVDMRSSIGLKSAKTEVSEAAQRGMQAVQEATAQYAVDGNKMTQKGVDIRQIVADKLFAQPTTTTVFIPRVGPAITWQPNSIQMQYDPGELNFDWETMRNTMDYVPGKFHMNILQYPRVNIEYLGEPNYVPPSANPNYEG